MQTRELDTQEGKDKTTEMFCKHSLFAVPLRGDTSPAAGAGEQRLGEPSSVEREKGDRSSLPS